MAFVDYHRRSIRLKTHNYQNGGIYFITICTEQRECFFGDIRHRIVGLSDAGCIIANEWQKTPNIRPYVTLDAWIIMPDHFHAIIQIGDDDNITNERTPGLNDERAICFDDERASYHDAPTRPRLLPDSLGSIIGQFKIITTKHIRKINPLFAWQRNYHEHIIRSEDERFRIRRYIMNNPTQWNIHPDDLL
jgi:putative transposase